MRMVWPVISEAAGEARNTTAPDTSTGLPIRCSAAIRSMVSARKSGSESAGRFAERVGKENVIASADCGFSSQAMYRTEVEPRIVWAKFRALSEGARIASQKLWR
jgi:hypothetical protein